MPFHLRSADSDVSVGTKGVTGSPKSGVKVKRAESNIGKSSLASKTTAGVSSASRRSTDDKSMQQSTPTTGTARSPSDAAKRPRETSVGRSRLNKGKIFRVRPLESGSPGLLLIVLLPTVYCEIAPRGSVGTASSAQSLLAVSDSGTNDDAQYRAKRHEELKAELFPEDVLT